MSRAAVALGSNLGDRAATLRAALERLAAVLRLEGVSPFYETDPVGYADQPPFLNAVATGDTALPPQSLLRELQRIEADFGRARPFPNAPRTLDLDLLFYGDLSLDTPDLTLPHPRLNERFFVLVPLADVAPDWRHPRLGRTVAELLTALGDPRGVRQFP